MLRSLVLDVLSTCGGRDGLQTWNDPYLLYLSSQQGSIQGKHTVPSFLVSEASCRRKHDRGVGVWLSYGGVSSHFQTRHQSFGGLAWPKKAKKAKLEYDWL